MITPIKTKCIACGKEFETIFIHDVCEECKGEEEE